MFGASEKEKVGNECNFASHCCTFSQRKRGTSSEKSADGKRRRRGRRKSEDRRKKTEAKIFLAQTLHHTPLTHLRRLTDTTSMKRGKEGATREGRLSLAHIQHVLKKFVDGKEEEKRQQKVKKNISGRLSIYLSHLHPPTTPRTP